MCGFRDSITQGKTEKRDILLKGFGHPEMNRGYVFERFPEKIFGALQGIDSFAGLQLNHVRYYEGDDSITGDAQMFREMRAGDPTQSLQYIDKKLSGEGVSLGKFFMEQLDIFDDVKGGYCLFHLQISVLAIDHREPHHCAIIGFLQKVALTDREYLVKTSRGASPSELSAHKQTALGMSVSDDRFEVVQALYWASLFDLFCNEFLGCETYIDNCLPMLSKKNQLITSLASMIDGFGKGLGVGKKEVLLCPFLITRITLLSWIRIGPTTAVK